LADKAKRNSKDTYKAKTAAQLIYDYSQIDMTEVSAILISKLESLMYTCPELARGYANPDDLDPVYLGQSLANIFSSEEMHELMNTEIGQGIILGVYFDRAMIAEKEAEEEASDGY
jgi:hypothetical protein